MTRNIEVRESGGFLQVLLDGAPVRPGARVSLSAAELAILVRDHTWAGVEADRQASSKATAALTQAVADAAAQAGAKSVAQPAFDAGVRYAAQAIAKSTRIRRTVERDANGQITGSVETREPMPSTEKPASKPIGFRPR